MDVLFRFVFGLNFCFWLSNYEIGEDKMLYYLFDDLFFVWYVLDWYLEFFEKFCGGDLLLFYVLKRGFERFVRFVLFRKNMGLLVDELMVGVFCGVIG